VRACIDGANLVFLDLRRDRYWSVPARTAPSIAGVTDAEARQGLSVPRLLDLELIEYADGDVASSPRRARAPERKLEYPGDVDPSLRDGIAFLAACIGASRTLSLRRLDLALDFLARRKAGLRNAATDAERAVGVFEHLRHWYPRKRVCLFDSVALMHFMLAKGLAPNIVLGVRTMPFAAHCWLELDGVLVGDTSDHCASFTPIAWV
jgi:hypothetical protein